MGLFKEWLLAQEMAAFAKPDQPFYQQKISDPEYRSFIPYVLDKQDIQYLNVFRKDRNFKRMDFSGQLNVIKNALMKLFGGRNDAMKRFIPGIIHTQPTAKSITVNVMGPGNQPIQKTIPYDVSSLIGRLSQLDPSTKQSMFDLANIHLSRMSARRVANDFLMNPGKTLAIPFEMASSRIKTNRGMRPAAEKPTGQQATRTPPQYSPDPQQVSLTSPHEPFSQQVSNVPHLSNVPQPQSKEKPKAKTKPQKSQELDLFDNPIDPKDEKRRLGRGWVPGVS